MKKYIWISVICLVVFGVFYISKPVTDKSVNFLIKGEKSQIKFICSALEAYHNEHKHYPNELKELSQGKFIEDKQLFDVWKNPYNYKVINTAGKEKYFLSSFGPDGIKGTKDDIELLSK